MAYQKTEWKNHVVQYPRRYTLSGAHTGEVTLTPAPGSVTQQGTPLDADHMNKIEDELVALDEFGNGLEEDLSNLKSNKNILKMALSERENPYNGITYTLFDDGSFSLNGTANAVYVHCFAVAELNANKTYVISGCPKHTGSDFHVDLRLQKNGGATVTPTYEEGDGFEYTPTEDITVYYGVRIGNGSTLNNQIFYPMIREKGTNSVYVPYDDSVKLIRNAIPSVVTYEMFGAVLDGITDDTIAIKKAHNYANRYGLKVQQNVGKIYIPSATKMSIEIKTDTDLSGCELIVNNPVIEPPFYVKGETTEYELGAYNISLLTDSKFLDFTKNYPNSHIAIEPNYIIVGDRYNGTEYYPLYHKYNTVTDENGNPSEPLPYDMSYVPDDMASTARIKVYVSSVLEKAINIRLPKITIIGKDGYAVNLFQCDRNNVTFYGNVIEGVGQESTPTTYFGHIIGVSRAYNVRLTGVTSDWWGDETTNNSSAYVISTVNCSNITIDNCNMHCGWGQIENEYLNNSFINNCDINRFDVHFGVYGKHNINNCIFRVSNNEVHSCSLGYGKGTVNINNVSVTRFTYGDFVYLRHDLPSIFSGTINMSNISIDGKKDMNILVRAIFGLIETTSNYNTLFTRALPKINISNIVSHTTCKLIKLESSSKQYVLDDTSLKMNISNAIGYFQCVFDQTQEVTTDIRVANTDKIGLFGSNAIHTKIALTSSNAYLNIIPKSIVAYGSELEFNEGMLSLSNADRIIMHGNILRGCNSIVTETIPTYSSLIGNHCDDMNISDNAVLNYYTKMPIAN